jgi:Domain of unknown function (DUF4160)
MPTIFFKFGFRFYFVSYDCGEPEHVHVSDGERKICKYWLRNNQVLLADSSGFTKRDLSKIERAIAENYSIILTTFHEFCKKYKK